MSLRTVSRYLSLILIIFIFLASGFQKISNPGVTAALLAKSNLPALLLKLGIDYQLNAHDYTMIVQGTGAIFIAFSLFILLGVGRSFFAVLLALTTILVTIVFHLDIDDLSKTRNEQLFHLLKDLSITGALLFVASSGNRSQRYYQARDYDDKKHQ